MKRNNISAEVWDSAVFKNELKESFDAVLCDVPCSGTGVMADDPDIKLNRTEENVRELNEIQRKILSASAGYVKKGGFIYYSTCSMLKYENEDIVNAFLAEHKDFVIERINSPLPHEDKGGANAFLPDISGGLGFFIAKMKKLR